MKDSERKVIWKALNPLKILSTSKMYVSILIRTFFFLASARKLSPTWHYYFGSDAAKSPGWKLALGQGFLEGSRVSLGARISLHLSVRCLLWQLHFQTGSICGWKTATMPLTYLSVGTSSMTERPPPTSSLSLSGPGWILYPWLKNHWDGGCTTLSGHFQVT